MLCRSFALRTSGFALGRRGFVTCANAIDASVVAVPARQFDPQGGCKLLGP